MLKYRMLKFNFNAPIFSELMLKSVLFYLNCSLFAGSTTIVSISATTGP
jgi:hypothetical protein